MFWSGYATAQMVLRAGYAGLALKLQEAANADLSNSDVQARLRDTISDAHRGTGKWAYYLDHFGDDESGDVIYSVDGDTRKASYEISKGADNAAKCTVDTEHSTNVVPRTVYEEEADEPDTYAAMEESFKTAKLYTALPFYERFIPKAERDSADAADFAGKNRSFPILSQADVTAAFHALGRAGSDNYSIATIRANIIRIAKRKGYKLPKSAEKATKESATPAEAALKLSESCAFPIDITLREAFGASHKIKIIAPGKGSSAFYPAEVLKRDGPKVFKAGTPMRIDHPTRADEAARPEGSVKDWGAVLATDAVWLDEHKQGPGLYAEIKPFSDHAAIIEEKGPYAGVSIRANGNALYENGKQVLRDGLPVLAEFTSAEGVDMVTRAGAGGMFLSESARTDPTNSTEGQVMEKEAIQLLIKEAVGAAIKPIADDRIARLAVERAAGILRGTNFSPEEQAFVIEEALRTPIAVTDAGALDEAKFDAVLMAEASRIGRLLGKEAKPRGVGVAVTEAKKGKKACPTCDGDGEDADGKDCPDCDGTGKMTESRRSDPDREVKELAARLVESGMSENAAMRAAKGRN
jgi:hypothetical protein